MKNYIQGGDLITIAAPSGGVVSGGGVVLGALFGVATCTAAAGESVVLATRGVFALAKASGTTFAAGAAVSFDVATGLCVAGATGKYPIGTATEAAGNGPLTVNVRLDGIATAAAA